MQKFATPSPVSAVLDIPARRARFIAADRADTTTAYGDIVARSL